MTTRERVLRFIHAYRRERQYGPTTREIAAGVGLASNSTAAMHLDNLRRDDLITWATLPNGEMITRSVRLTPAGRDAATRPVPPPPCPECGGERRHMSSARGEWYHCNACGHVEIADGSEEVVA